AHAPFFTPNLINFDFQLFTWTQLYYLFTFTPTRVFASLDEGRSWFDFSNGIKNEVNITLPYITDEHLMFSDGHKKTIWLRPLTDLNGKPTAGSVYLDYNKNGIRDVGDRDLKEIVIKAIPTATYATTDTLGDYYILDITPGDTIIPTIPFPFTTVTPAYYVVNEPSSGKDFAVSLTEQYKDLRVTVQGDIVRAGFEEEFIITIVNEGFDTLSDTLELIYNDVFTLADTMPAYSYAYNNIVGWVFNNLVPFEKRTYKIRLKTKIVPLRTYFSLQARALIENDITPLNNLDTLIDEVRLAFDPNDKLVNQKILNTQEAFDGAALTYTIRFQNTGNYPAFLVRITDTLSNWLLPESMKILAASHPYTFKMNGKGAVEIRFDDIQLPDSTSNEPESHGFIKYSIRTKPNLPFDAVIDNTAHIYFDFNEAVITNTVETIIDKINSTMDGDITKVQSLEAFPNPSLGEFFLNTNILGTENIEFEIYSSKGFLLNKLNNKKNSIDLTNYPAGGYYLIGRTHKTVYIAKLVKI
ncbi:MAG: T9SS type A sorting domain-containing protein, partial [Bacteroidia bacterium]